MDLKELIRAIPDFPKPGILYRDLSPLLAHPSAWEQTIVKMEEALLPYQPELLVGIESRGFLVAAPLALQLGLGFAMVRKKGKLPGDTIAYSYSLEYGNDTLEIQDGAIHAGKRVVVLDDLLATGGTMAAAIHLLRVVGADVVAAGCIMELAALKGREKIDVPFVSLVSFDD